MWFVAIGLLGLAGIAVRPEVLAAVLPSHAVAFVAAHPLAAFIALGSVVLAVTGAEALYADLGHFGRRPIERMWVLFVLPALMLNYFGQGALVLSDPAALENPFYLLAPEWLRLPLVFLAAAATVIASQAMVSGAFSIARQCVQLGFMPRLVVRHTSGTEEGQIYLPQVNFALLFGVPFGIPQPVIDRLNAAVREVWDQAEVQKLLRDLGAEPAAGSTARKLLPCRSRM